MLTHKTDTITRRIKRKWSLTLSQTDDSFLLSYLHYDNSLETETSKLGIILKLN